MDEIHEKKRRANITLAWVLGAFAVFVLLYSMRYIWPNVDIFSK